jgi:hypothetical protein
LALLYPSFDFSNKFHQDHIFPKAGFKKTELKAAGFSSEKIDFYLNNYNCLANLQLLKGVQNQEKSDTPFAIWINATYKTPHERDAYMQEHHIPKVDFDLNNFETFIKERKKTITGYLKKNLNIAPDSQ